MALLKTLQISFILFLLVILKKVVVLDIIVFEFIFLVLLVHAVSSKDLTVILKCLWLILDVLSVFEYYFGGFGGRVGAQGSVLLTLSFLSDLLGRLQVPWTP